MRISIEKHDQRIEGNKGCSREDIARAGTDSEFSYLPEALDALNAVFSVGNI